MAYDKVKFFFPKGKSPLASSLIMSLALGWPSSSAGQSLDSSFASSKIQPSHIQVQSIKSSQGIEAWVVEGHEIPVVSVAIAFKNAGNASDPQEILGLVQLLSGMLNEGAGEWDGQGFKKFLLKNNIELTVTASQDIFQITFRVVKKNIAEAFQVLNAILTSPRFDSVSLERIKTQIYSILAQSLYSERTLASQKLTSLIYGKHPYGKKIEEILQTLPKITDSHLRQFMKDRFARDQLLVSIVGDITPNEAKGYLDKSLGCLPEKATFSRMEKAELLNMGKTIVEPLDIPQSLVNFVQPGIPRSDPDFYTALIMMKILGDGQFESRLWDEVREKRGLAYGIDADLSWSQHSSLVLGGTATKNTTVKEVMDIIRSAWQTMAEKGATQAELDFVKKRMISSFPLNFSSTMKIAKALLIYQVDELGVDYINKRNEIISAITLDQVNKVAKSLLKPDQLTFVIVGKPEEVSVSQSSGKEKEGEAGK